MADRVVRKVSPSPSTGEAPKNFSDYAEIPNIVLLGDPGMGKSHLFRYAAGNESGRVIRARDFVNLPSPDTIVLFIDALDEKRAGRADHSTIDTIVNKLSLVRPLKVRIACRTADWLGETDLAAFRAYFEGTGGYVVLSLEPLSETDCIVLLREKGVLEPATFLEDARKRGLDDLLANPQNLIMLSEVVRQGAWPKNRTELFSKAVKLLLSEHNLEHTRQPIGGFSAEELMEAAGGVCAVHLISDIAGISLEENSSNTDYPSYRSISVADRDKVLAALGRRVFVGGLLPETVEYAHRTIAEYLAARWIATKVRSGLPIGRVRALIGSDGRPASELRGLHAWLAVFLPENAHTLIDADPYGVLSYGDAASLTQSHRKSLIEALGQLAEIDPWFRAGNWSSATVAALSGSDMEEDFRAILGNRHAEFSLRSVVLDALSAGPPIPGLQEDLVHILGESTAPYAERNASVKALLATGEEGKTLIVQTYGALGLSEDDLRLRANILQELYGSPLGVDQIASLLCDALRTDADLVGGVFWHLGDVVPDRDIAAILDRVADSAPLDSVPNEHHNLYEVVLVMDDLLTRFVANRIDADGMPLLRWLEMRRRCHKEYGRGSSGSLKEALTSNQAALTHLADAAILSLQKDETSWQFISRINELSLGTISATTLLHRVASSLGSTIDEKTLTLYEVGLLLAFRVGAEARSVFESLYNLADGNQSLESVRARSCVDDVPDWKREESLRRAKRDAERTADMAETRKAFEEGKEKIRSGTELRWLGWIGDMYFGRFIDVDRDVGPHQRLITELGEENAQVALSALLALVQSQHITKLADVLRLHADGKYCRWWYAIIAGLDESIIEEQDLSALPEGYVQAVLAIDCLHPTFGHQGNTQYQIEHKWKTPMIQRNPQWAVDSYMALARDSLTRGSSYVQGLHELSTSEPLAPFRTECGMALLEEFPTPSVQTIKELLQIVLKDADSSRLERLVRSRLSRKPHNTASDLECQWLAAGFLLEPEEFIPSIDALDNTSSEKVVWAVRDLMGHRRGKNNDRVWISLKQLEYLVRLVSTHFPKAVHPRAGGWVGSTNPWDATDLLQTLINEISSSSSEEASTILTRLSADEAIVDFRDELKHALAQQRVRRVDAQYEQPNWQDALRALKNGPPAGVADLHALVLAHLNDLQSDISGGNTDLYKRFWNEDRYGRVKNPKNENSCRNVLVDLLRSRLNHYGVRVEPEAHMASAKRADIVVTWSTMKLVIELKRHYHPEIWTAAHEQLDRFYTRDPEALGFGIYGVFWFGLDGKRPVPKPPEPLSVPSSAIEMQSQLQSSVPVERRTKLQVAVLDVSGVIP